MSQKVNKINISAGTKICSCCKLPREYREFRTRVDKRITPPLVYLNATCLQCDSGMERARHEVKKNDPGYKAQHSAWARAFYKRHRKKCLADAKLRRSTKAYKANREVYREAHKEKIAGQESVCKKRYHEKNRNALTDRYIINLLRTQKIITSEEYPNLKELIEEKRNKILLWRKRFNIDYGRIDVQAIEAIQKSRESKPYEFVNSWRD